MTGGDEFDVHIKAERDAHLTVTTQACERAYRAQPGETGHIRNRLSVAAGARLSWLPQETILYDRCSLDRALHIDMDEDAILLLVEPMIFGRTEMGETVSLGSFRDRIDIRRAGQALYLDAIHLNGDIERHLSRPTVAKGARAFASVIYAAPNAGAHLDPLRAMLPDNAGVSLIGDDLLALRILGADGFSLRKALFPVLTRLSGTDLPRCWTI